MKSQSPPQPQSVDGSSMFLGSSAVAISGSECSNAGGDVAKIVVQNYIYLPDIEVGDSKQDRAGNAGHRFKTARSLRPSVNRLSRALKVTQEQETENENESCESAAASDSKRACQPKLEPIADDIDLLYADIVTSKRASRPKLESIADDNGLLHMDVATSKRVSQPKLEVTADDSDLSHTGVSTSKRTSQQKLEAIADDSDLSHTGVATSERTSEPKLEAIADIIDLLHTGVATSERTSEPKLEAIADIIDLLHTGVATNIHTVVKNETCTILPINAGNLNSIPEIYTHHMLAHALGYPLYIPEPDHGLPREYRKRGVRIGDVGSITPEGAFDFLFNICLPADHPINPSDLPNSFEMLPTSDISIIPQFIPPGDYRCSDGVLELDDQLNKFRCTTFEGAVLLFPAGATLFKSKNAPLFQDFAARHSEDWYKYMVDRGRNTPNGSLYLVTGCIKSRNWANATFYKGPSPSNYAQLVTTNAQPAYSWRKLGKVSPRTGPISEETGELNQCEFLYGFKIMLRQDLLDELSSTVSVPSQKGQNSPSQAPASNGDCGDNGTSTSSSTTKKESHVEEGNTSQSRRSCFSGELVVEANFPTAPPLHPSDLINSLLLRSDLSAKVAITHDAVWCETLLKFSIDRSDFTMGDMLDAITERYSSTTDQFGCISLAGKIRDDVDAYEDHCDDVEMFDATSSHYLKNDTTTQNISESLGLIEHVASADASLENDIEHSMSSAGNWYENAQKKRRRTCDVCKKKKVKCDSGERGRRPCTNCETLGHKCTHKATTRATGAAKGHVDNLEMRLENMEKILTKLFPGVDLNTDLEHLVATLPPDTTNNYGLTFPSSSKSQESSTLIPRNDEEDETVAEDTDGITFRIHNLKLDPSEHPYFGKSSRFQLIQMVLDIKRESMESVTREFGGKPFKTRKRQEFWRAEPWEKTLMDETPMEDVSSIEYPDPDLLPSLVDNYFNEINIIYPVLHRPTFERQIAEGLHLKDVMFGYTVLLVCAHGAKYSDDPRIFIEGSNSTRSAGYKWYAQVNSGKTSFSEKTTLHALQMHTLYVAFAKSTSMSQGLWTQAGVAMRMALEVGAHRRRLRKGGRQTAEDELWKRAFWSLFALENIMSAISGRPCSLHEEDYDQEYPAECDDEFWEHPDPSRCFQQPENKTSYMAYFACFLRLVKILARVMRYVYSVRRCTTQVERKSDQQVIAELDSAMNEWMDCVPDHLLWNTNTENSLFLKQSASLHAMYYQVQIFIHRPFIPSPRNPSAIAFPSMAICTNAARSCCLMLDPFIRLKLIPSPSIQATSSTAALVLLVNVLNAKRMGLVNNCRRDMELFRKVVDILGCCEKRWCSAGRHRDILIELVSFNDLD